MMSWGLVSQFLDNWNEEILVVIGTVVVPVSLFVISRMLNRRKRLEAQSRDYGERIAHLEGSDRSKNH